CLSRPHWRLMRTTNELAGNRHRSANFFSPFEEHDRKWRRGWDSNPRDPCRPGGFQDRCYRPLSHPSAWGEGESLPARLDPCEASEVGAEGVGQEDGAVGLLVVLEDGDERPADGEARAVERVEEARLAAVRGAVAEVGAPGLEVGAVRAGGDLAVGVLAGEPDFEIVGLGCGEAHVAGREADAAVGEVELFEDALGVARQLFERGEAGLGGRQVDQLDLVELVLADEPADVLAVRAGLAAEAGG